MAEIRINTTGGLKLYDADNSHYAQIVAGTITSNVDAITLGHNLATFNAAVTATGILKTDDTTEATSTTDGSLQTDGGLSVAKDTVMGDDLKLLSDSSVIHFGTNSEVTLTHSHDAGLNLKHTATADDKPVVLTLQTGETDMAANDVIGKIAFQAPDESTGTDAILVSAAIQAVAEGDHSSSSNATRIEFMVGASEAAAKKMQLTSAGKLEIDGGLDVEGGVVFNEDSASVDFRVESNGDANCLIVDGSGDKVGIGEDVPEGKLHVFTGDASVGPNANADELVVEGSAHSGISILSGNSSQGGIYFGDSGDDNEATIVYDHSTGALNFTTFTTDSLRIRDAKISTNGEDAPDVDAGGITIDLNANDGNFLSLKSSDYSHGITGRLETDTGFAIQKSQAGGGVSMMACNDGQNENIFTLTSVMGETNTTATNSTSGGNFTFNAACKADSGTGTKSVADAGNAWVLRNDNAAKLIFKGDGEVHSDTGSTTFDAYEDAHLVRAFDLSHGRGVINSKFDKFISYNHEKLADLGLVGRNEDGTPNHFTNITGMQKLHNGAIWQQYEKHNQLLEAVYDLAKEAVGEEKADAILDKHEVKRLQ